MTQFNTLVEEMAAMEHTRWSKWQSYLHSKCIKNEDGSLTIPAGLVVHWERQISTPYSQLTEPEKEADRREVRPYIEYATQTTTRVREETIEEAVRYIEDARQEHNDARHGTSTDDAYDRACDAVNLLSTLNK